MLRVHRSKYAHPAGLVAGILLILLMVPVADAATGIVRQTVLYTPTGGDSFRGVYYTNVAYNAAENAAYGCYSLRENTAHHFAVSRSTNHGLSASHTKYGGGGAGSITGACSTTGTGTYAVWQTAGTCRMRSLHDSSLINFDFDSFVGTCGNSVMRPEPIFISSTDFGVMGRTGVIYYNGTASATSAYPTGVAAHPDSVEVDGVIYAVFTASNGRFYSAEITSVDDGITYAEVETSGVYHADDSRPKITHDGTDFIACYQTTSGLIRAVSPDFITWSKTVVTTVTNNRDCVVFAGSEAVAQGEKFFFKEDDGGSYQSFIYADIDESSATIQTDGYSVTGSTLYLWHEQEPVLDNGKQRRVLAATEIGGVTQTTGGIAADPINPVGAAKDFFDDSWNTDPTVSGWLFGLTVISVTTFFFSKHTGGSAFGTVMGGLLGTGLAIALGFVPLWFLLLIVFLALAAISKVFFGGSGESDA